ncbi:MAG TPA: glycosyltransferase family 4 protein [Actinomycetales bacterium]|nr:glycosyltransferase family 4 protein [Actinomycetales bacterium]
MRAVVIRARTSLVRREAEVASPPALPAALAHSLLSTSDVSSVDRLELAAPQGSRVSWAALAEQVATVQRDADVTHALDLVAGAAALSARRVTGVPVVVRAQLRGAGTGPSGRTAVRAAVLRAADAVLVPTEADRELARALGADPQRLRLCPDAALVTHTECGGRPHRDGPAPDADVDGRYLLGMSGVPCQRATQEGLLRALVRDKELRLLLVGPRPTGPAQDALARRARALRVADRVQVRPWHETPDLVDLVDAASVVLATRPEPTSALSALLAMRRARPVVAVGSPAAAEVLVDGVTGRLVPPGDVNGLADAVCRTAADGFRQLAWGQAGLDRVTARYDAHAVVTAITSAYDRSRSQAAPAA